MKCYAAFGVTTDPQQGVVPWVTCYQKCGHDGPHLGIRGTASTYGWRDSDRWAWLPGYTEPLACVSGDEFVPPE